MQWLGDKSLVSEVVVATCSIFYFVVSEVAIAAFSILYFVNQMV